VTAEALTWVVHFVADLHQPLHAIADDRDGNDVFVQFNGRQTNLHRLWDEDMIDRVYPGQAMLQEGLLAVLQAWRWRVWQGGRPEDWAEETHRGAVEAVYLFPASREITSGTWRRPCPSSGALCPARAVPPRLNRRAMGRRLIRLGLQAAILRFSAPPLRHPLGTAAARRATAALALAPV